MMQSHSISNGDGNGNDVQPMSVAAAITVPPPVVPLQQRVAMQNPAAAMVMHHLMMAPSPGHYMPYHPHQFHRAVAAQQPQQGGGGGENRTAWVGDLHNWMDVDYLRSCFASTGEVVSIKVIRNKQTGFSEGYGFVEFFSHAAADKVLQTYRCIAMPNTKKLYCLNWATLSMEDKLSYNGFDLSLFVGDLAADVTDTLLHETFANNYLSVEAAKFVIDANTGRSKGYGFVRFGDDGERTQAMAEMNGTYCSSRPMRVGAATPRKSSGYQQQFGLPGSYMWNGGSRSDADFNNTTIFVGGLDPTVSDADLKQPFSQYGEIVSVKISVGKRCGFVQFAIRNNAEEALQKLNGTTIGKQTVRLPWRCNPANKHMEQKLFSCGSVRDRFPPLSPKYQWFVAQSPQADEDGNGDHFFYNIQDPLSFYRCRIPELHKKRIRGSFHGWLILSNDNMWSLWNPVTSKIMHLPPLVLTDGDSTSIKECCLSLPPDYPKSILLLTRTDKPNFVFCLLNRRRKRLNWNEISYTKQLKRISGEYALLVHSLCCCNDKVYALSTDNLLYEFVIEIGIVVKDGGVVIKFMPFSGCPVMPYSRGHEFMHFLIGSNAELFCIMIGFDFRVIEDTTFSFVSLNKVDMTRLNWEKLEGLKNWDITGKRPADMEEEDVNNMWNSSDIWEQMKDLKDGDFFVDLARDNSVAYSPTIASEFGGNIHIRSRMGKFIYSYNLSDRTIMLSSMFPSPLLPTSHVSVWECSLAADYAKTKQVENKDRGIVVPLVNDDDVELDESRLLNLPHGVFEMIMEFCIGLEYLNFRATCKRCHLAAPVVQWGDEVALKRLQNYSLLSPWLMMADEKQGIVTFEDPLYGYKYFMKKLCPPVADGEKCYSVYGWLLYYSTRGLEFCNPFTNEVHHLPEIDDYLDRFCFSAPPTSPDSMVVGFGTEGIYIHFVHGEQTWRLIGRLDNDNDDDDDDDDYSAIYYPTFYGRDVYALCAEGYLYIFKNMGQEDYSFKQDVVEAPRSCARSYPVEYFLTKCDQDVLLVFVDHFGESIEVFRLNDLTKEWEKTSGLGRRTIYISDNACICIEAKTREMEDKIFFARFYNKNGKVVFYSLETGMYHTSNDKNIEESFGDFVGTKHPLYAHAWIEPTWAAIKTYAV